MQTGVAKKGFPSQIKYIVGNEACERFSFYGMRSILTIFMVKYLMMPEHEAKGLYHLFMSTAYFTPLFGAYLADRYWGKYKTIFWLSFFYCIGHGVLATWESKEGLIAGLFLIAIGSGGIKPCVSAHVGDQFDATNQHLLSKIYEIFYWSINFGAFFSTLLIPFLLLKYGPSVAFALPGILMMIATIVFWMGRKQYVIVPPTGKEGSGQFFAVLWHGITNFSKRPAGGSFLDTAIAKFGAEKVEAAKSVLEVAKIFIIIVMFWALYDQQGSSWTLQAERMNPNFLGTVWSASQIQALNPILILIMVPVFSLGIYPMVEKMGIQLTPLRKMGTGMVMTSLSFVSIGILQVLVDSGYNLNVGWQVIPYFLMTLAEVMVSITGLEFAYTQAPRSMKSTVMSLFMLTVAAGNFLTSVISYMNRMSGAGEFFFYAAVMAVVAVFFIWRATQYKGRTYLEPARH